MYFLKTKKNNTKNSPVSCRVAPSRVSCVSGVSQSLTVRLLFAFSFGQLNVFLFSLFVAGYEIYLNSLNFRGQLPFTEATCWRRRCCRDNGPDSNLYLIRKFRWCLILCTVSLSLPQLYLLASLSHSAASSSSLSFCQPLSFSLLHALFKTKSAAKCENATSDKWRVVFQCHIVVFLLLLLFVSTFFFAYLVIAVVVVVVCLVTVIFHMSC